LHRDLKPSNIFLDDKQNAKLGDFGFAKALGGADGESDYAKTYLGSPYYMSPEQCNGQGYNEKSDIWSLGIVLYELAQLTPPFMATNQLSLALKIKEGSFKRIPSRYTEELMRVIKWMLQVEPEERPNVEDLLNLPHVSMRLRERALKRNLQHMKKKEEEVVRKEEKLRSKQQSILAKETELDEREKQIVLLEQ
jgi:NIMA (never in mitosis gene a)-related kinase 2